MPGDVVMFNSRALLVRDDGGSFSSVRPGKFTCALMIALVGDEAWLLRPDNTLIRINAHCLYKAF